MTTETPRHPDIDGLTGLVGRLDPADADLVAAAVDYIGWLTEQSELMESEHEADQVLIGRWEKLLADTTAERDALAAKIEQVRALHHDVHVTIGPDDLVGGYVCAVCGMPTESEPCDTVRILDADEPATNAAAQDAEPAPDDAGVIDLVAALKASVAAAKRRRDQGEVPS